MTQTAKRAGVRWGWVAENVALAVEETLATPVPGLGHGPVADLAALVTFAVAALAG